MDEELFLREDYLQAAFNMFDKDRSGRIDFDELLAIVKGDGPSNALQEAAVSNAIHEIDVNGDGEIDLSEFILMMAKATEVEEQIKEGVMKEKEECEQCEECIKSKS